VLAEHRTQPRAQGEFFDTLIDVWNGHRPGCDELPRRLGRGSPDEILAVLLAGLAVDRSTRHPRGRRRRPG
jgi:hypothetical protein